MVRPGRSAQARKPVPLRRRQQPHARHRYLEAGARQLRPYRGGRRREIHRRIGTRRRVQCAERRLALSTTHRENDMTFHSDITPPLAWLTKGAAIGLAGGLAEVIVVGAYSSVAGVDASGVAGAIATAVRIDPGSAATGLVVHMALSALLGIGLLAVAKGSGLLRTGAMRLLALASVWILNFFVVLPILSPGFVHLLPYAVTLASKLMFAVAAVV